MRVEWLEDIIMIAQTGSFSAAAERRRMSQSAFSRRIKQIEEHIGVELFDRSHKPVALRATTLDQSERIAQLAAALRQLEVDLRRGDRIAKNRIVIATQHSLTASLTPSIIRGIQYRGEKIYVRLRSANLDECFGLLLSRQADIAIVHFLADEPYETGADYLETITIGTDRLIPVFSKDLVFDRDAKADADEIAYIAYPSDVYFGKAMARQILPLLGPAATPVPMAETALTLAALEMAAAGIGVAWVPRALARTRILNGTLVDLSDVLPGCDLLTKAAHLPGASGPVETAFWTQLQSLQPEP